MEFRWAQFVNVAQRLATEEGEEYYRSAISRAYYAAFGVAWGKLSRQDRQTISNNPKKNKHEGTWDVYMGDYSSDNESIGEVGAALKAQRHIADYNADWTVKSSEATLAIKQAQKLIKEIDKLSTR